MQDPNVLYSALSSFARVLYAERSVINRGSVDSMALQRYKTQIVQCLSHQDPSIRRRALDVISALIDDKNVETLIPEILSYVKLADAEFRTELVSKIYAATQRFAPTPIWNFDTVLHILVDSGDYVPMEIISSFCALIGATAALQPHAVQRLSEALVNASDNQSLIQVAAFVVGEFAAADDGAIAALRQIAILPQTKPETLLYVITAVSKLAVRVGDVSAAIELLNVGIQNNHLEVQQRSGELLKLITNYAGHCEEVLAPVRHSTEGDDRASIQINRDAGAAKAAENAAGDDLLNLILDTKGQQQAPGRSNDLLGLIDGPNVKPLQPPITAQVRQPPITAPVVAQVPQPMPLLETSDFVIYGQIKVNPPTPTQIALRMLIYGIGTTPLTDFALQVTAAPGWKAAPQPMAPAALAPNRQSPLSVIVHLVNMNNAPFALYVTASYKFGAQPVTERGTISRLPPP
jgi:hypothetical protein